MAAVPVPLPDDVSATTFAAAAARYGDVIAAVSAAKGAKDGQKTLAELDVFRYETAPALFGTSATRRAMTLDDVQTLVQWKLRHGKFRPTLMKLVASNDPAKVEQTVQDALAAYDAALAAPKGPATGPAVADPDPRRLQAHARAAAAAVGVLSTLRGIGPATASLLVAVHHPQQTLFFSDEAYAWLCGGAVHAAPRKYNAKEYAQLAESAAALLGHLGHGFGMQAVEKAAYVLMHDSKAKAKATPTTTPAKTAAAPLRSPHPPADAKKRKEPPGDKAPAGAKKRKEPPGDKAPAGAVPRSMRRRRS